MSFPRGLNPLGILPRWKNGKGLALRMSFGGGCNEFSIHYRYTKPTPLIKDRVSCTNFMQNLKLSGNKMIPPEVLAEPYLYYELSHSMVQVKNLVVFRDFSFSSYFVNDFSLIPCR